MTNTTMQQSSVDHLAAPVRFCFVCGAPMGESWRSEEQGGHYVWYECTRPGCDQTYLIRENSDDGPCFNEMTCQS